MLWSYEAGYKSRFADGRGEFNIDGFFINASSYVSAASVSLGGIHVTVPTAVGRVHSDGVETNASYRFTEHLSVQFDGGWNKAIPVKLSSNAVPGAAVLGQQVTDAPKYNFRLGPVMTLPAGADRLVTLSGGSERNGAHQLPGQLHHRGSCEAQSILPVGSVCRARFGRPLSCDGIRQEFDQQGLSRYGTGPISAR